MEEVCRTTSLDLLKLKMEFIYVKNMDCNSWEETPSHIPPPKKDSKGNSKYIKETHFMEYIKETQG